MSIATTQLSLTTLGASRLAARFRNTGKTPSVAIPPRASAASWRTISSSLSSSRTLPNAGTECGSDIWPKTKATSCLKRGEQISFGESRAEESASIAAGVPILRKVKRARYLTNRERDGSRRVLVRVETSAPMYERDDGLRSDEGSAGAGSSNVNSLQKINNATIRRSKRILVDPRVLLLRLYRFGVAFLRIVPLNLCRSNLARFPSLPVSRRSRTPSTSVYSAPTRLLPWPRPLEWNLPSNLEGRVRGWVRQKGSSFDPCHIQDHVSREQTVQ